MSKYRAVYKCQLCEDMFCTGEPREIPYNELPRLLGAVVRNQQFVGNPYLHQAPMHIPHKCRDGSAGLAQFAGFVVAG